MAFQDVQKKATYFSFCQDKYDLQKKVDTAKEKGREVDESTFILPKGQKVGYYQHTFVKEGEYNGQPKKDYVHYFIGEDKETLFAINGVASMNYQMEKVEKGVLTEITYEGRKGNKHKVSVRFDPEQSYLERKEEPKADQEDSGPVMDPSKVA